MSYRTNKAIINVLFCFFLAINLYGQEIPMPYKPLNGGCNRDSTITYNWDGIKVAKRLFHYNDKSLLDTVWYYKVDGRYEILQSITSYLHDSLGNTLSIYKESFNVDECSQDEQSIFSYDNSGRMIRITYLKNIDGVMTKNREIQNVYGKNDAIQEIYTDILDARRPSSRKSIYNFDTLNRLIMTVDFEKEHGEWNAFYRTLFSYDSNDSLIERKTGRSEGNEMQFRDFGVTKYNRDDKGNLTEQINYSCNVNTSSLLEQGRILNKYDSNNNIIKRFEQIYSNNSWKNMWVIDRFYNCDTAAKFSGSGALELFPNPAFNLVHLKSKVSISNGVVSIYNADGRQVIYQSFTPEINIESLSSGIYLVMLISEGSIMSGKLVKL